SRLAPYAQIIGPQARHDLPGADDPPESAHADLRAFRRGAAHPRTGHGTRRGAPSRIGSAAGDGDPADAVSVLSARVFRRHAAATDDRAGPGFAAGIRGGR